MRQLSLDAFKIVKSTFIHLEMKITENINSTKTRNLSYLAYPFHLLPVTFAILIKCGRAPCTFLNFSDFFYYCVMYQSNIQMKSISGIPKQCKEDFSVDKSFSAS